MDTNTAPIATGVLIAHEITPNESTHTIHHVSQPIIDILNRYSELNGDTMAIYGGLYALGCALASIGVNLEEGVDLRQQLSPLLDSYAAMHQTAAH